MRGADLVTRALTEAGVDTIFSLSGNQIMPIYDACVDVAIRLVHVRHEAAAVYMAEGWAQLSGSVGVALLTAAPGLANGLGPLYSARASESPVVLLSGDAPIAQDGRGAFQELAQTAVTKPLTKASFRATSADDVEYDIARAIRIACSGRPGPVHVALPFDVLEAQTGNPAVPARESLAADTSIPVAAEMETIAAALETAERPLVVLGPSSNASRAGGLADWLADAVDAPVITMESPRGLRDPSIGRLFRSIAQADLILSLGKAVDYSLDFGTPPAVSPTCRWIVIDPESDQLERARRNLGARLASAHRADVAAAVERLVQLARRPRSGRDRWRSEIAAEIAFRGFETRDDASAGRIHPAILCEAVQRQIDAADRAIFVADGGEFGQWAQACISAPRRVINGPAGAIGGGLCYAIAAKLADPGATVFALMGDGTSGFHFSEFETAVRCRTPFIAVIGHDACWNAEHQIQLSKYGPDRLIGCQLNPTRYDLAAQGLGCHGEHVTAPDQLDAALTRAVKSGLPACVNAEIEGLPAPGRGASH